MPEGLLFRFVYYVLMIKYILFHLISGLREINWIELTIVVNPFVFAQGLFCWNNSLSSSTHLRQ